MFATRKEKPEREQCQDGWHWSDFRREGGFKKRNSSNHQLVKM